MAFAKDKNKQVIKDVVKIELAQQLVSPRRAHAAFARRGSAVLDACAHMY